jgi:hypothetical protein
MKVITVRSQIQGIAAKWKERYTVRAKAGLYWRETLMRGDSAQDIHEKLLTLDTATATLEDVAAIIGNDTWIRPLVCEECGRVCQAVVEFDTECEGQVGSLQLCAICLWDAGNIIAGAE